MTLDGVSGAIYEPEPGKPKRRFSKTISTNINHDNRKIGIPSHRTHKNNNSTELLLKSVTIAPNQLNHH